MFKFVRATIRALVVLLWPAHIVFASLLLLTIVFEQINDDDDDDELQPLPRWAKKSWWTLVHKQKSYRRIRWPTQVEFRRDFRHLSTLIPQVARCERHLNHPKKSLQSDLRRRAALRWALLHISSFSYNEALNKSDLDRLDYRRDLITKKLIQRN